MKLVAISLGAFFFGILVCFGAVKYNEFNVSTVSLSFKDPKTAQEKQVVHLTDNGFVCIDVPFMAKQLKNEKK